MAKVRHLLKMKDRIVVQGVSILLIFLSLAGCATQPTEVARNDDAYTPIGSNIPRRDKKPEQRTALPPGQYIPAPSAPRN